MKKNEMDQFQRENAPNIIRTVELQTSSLIKEGKKVKFTFGTDGCAYCTIGDEMEIHVGSSKWLVEGEEGREKYLAILGYEPTIREAYIDFMDLAFHELGHAFFTRPGKLIERLTLRFMKEYKKRNPSASKYQNAFMEMKIKQYLGLLFNFAEDPRIETLMRFLFNVGQYFDFGRQLDYLVADTASEIQSWNFGYALMQLGTVGQYPQFQIEPEAYEALEAIQHVAIPGSTDTKNLIVDYLSEPYPAVSNSIFESWFDVPEFFNYIDSLIQREFEPQSEISEKLANMLANLPQEVRVGSGNGSANSIPVNLPKNFKPQPKLANDANQNGAGGSEGEKKDGAENQNGSGNGKSADGKDKKDQSANGKNGQKDAKESSDGESSDGESSGQSGDTAGNNADGAGSEASQNSSNNAPEGTPQEQDTFDENGNWQLNESDGKENTAEPLAENVDIRAELDATIAALTPKANAALKPKQTKKPKERVDTKNMSTAEVDIDTSFVPTKLAPTKVVTAAKPLRTALRKQRSENAETEIYARRSGLLDTSSLYRYKLRQTNVFKQNKLPGIKESVYYICWDGSGSMYGEKQAESALACAVIEEAVRDIYPLKIINFSTHGKVVHYLVKDFDDKTKKNCAYSFGAQRSFSGGNKVGFSIRQCTEELMRRREENKFLIVLSDGAPSDYNSHKEAVNDVKSAVAYAKKNRIDVTSVFFGSKRERDAEIGLYNEMYGAGHVISCEPDEIVNHLVKIVKENAFGRN
jgi:hypothetical protein